MSDERVLNIFVVWDGLGGAKLGKAVGHIKDEDNKETISGALDLEVAEEGIGSEEVESLVDDVCLRRIRFKAETIF